MVKKWIISRFSGKYKVEKIVTVTCTLIILIFDRLNNITIVELGWVIAPIWIINALFLFIWISNYIVDRRKTLTND